MVKAIFSYLNKYFNLENGWLDIFLGQTQTIAYLALFVWLTDYVLLFLPNVRIPKIWYVFLELLLFYLLWQQLGSCFRCIWITMQTELFDFRSAFSSNILQSIYGLVYFSYGPDSNHRCSR